MGKENGPESGIQKWKTNENILSWANARQKSAMTTLSIHPCPKPTSKPFNLINPDNN